MDSKEPLLGQWQDDGDTVVPTDGEDRKEEAPRLLRWNHIVALVLMLVVLGWTCSRVARFVGHLTRPLEQPTEYTYSRTAMTLEDQFAEIKPSTHLEWHECLGPRYSCARLTVPMDYNRPLNTSKDHPKVEIALMMYESIKSKMSGTYSVSPLLLNPGGPGGSGVGFAAIIGPQLQQILPDQDIVGFDPRGIGFTTPIADCFSFPSAGKGGEISREDYERGWFNRFNFLLTGLSLGLVNSSSNAITNLDARARGVGKLCRAKDAFEGQGSILRHMSTPAVAQDMVSIIDAWDTWRSKTEQTTAMESKVDKPEASRKSTEGKLVFWGFSYGTLLGATFASMFPDRIGRVILDGVVDADYYVGPIWGDSLRDTDAAEASFFKYCYEGKEACALYRDLDTEEKIQARFNSIMESLREYPITGINTVHNVPVQITYANIKSIMFASFYSPIFVFPLAAQILDIIDRGMYDVLLSNFALAIEFKSFCEATYFHPGGEAQAAIMCSDKRYPLNETVPNLQARFERIANVSHYADIWTTLMLGCDGWGIEATDPPMRWDRHPAHKQKPIKTSFPLLFISNTADPVTPLYAGVKMAKKFVNAGLVEQLSEGHCSLAAVSLCTLDKVKRYFLNGDVPPPPKWGKDGELEGGEWDRCESNQKPFQSSNAGDQGAASIEDITTLRAWSDVGRKTMQLEWFGVKLPPGMQNLASQIYDGLKLSDCQMDSRVIIEN